MGKKLRTMLVFLSLFAGMSFVACGGKKAAERGKEAMADTIESQKRLVEVGKLLMENKSDIQALWKVEIGDSKPAVKYALAGEYVYLSSADGKEGMLLTFYQDGRDDENFDGVAKKRNQEMSLYGKNVVVRQNMGDSVKNTYFENTEREGLNAVLVVMEKEGRQYYYNNASGEVPAAEARKIIEEFGAASPVPLEKLLRDWKKLIDK